jgi:hypothetical protein
MAHLDGEVRWFERGEEVPEEWAEAISNESVFEELGEVEEQEDDEVVLTTFDPTFPGFEDLRKVDEIRSWVDAGQDGERMARAQHALDAELASSAPRMTLVTELRSVLGLS